MLTAKQALCLLASLMVSIVLCLGDQSIVFQILTIGIDQ